jgi:hypothetical protein
MPIPETLRCNTNGIRRLERVTLLGDKINGILLELSTE